MMKKQTMISSASKTAEKVLFFDGTKAKEIGLKEAPNVNKVGLCFSDKELITYNFDLERGLDQERTNEAIEVKMFQEAGLNPMVDYKIVYSKTSSKIDATKNHVQAFAAPLLALEKISKEFVKKYGFIDLVLPTTALPKVLYQEKIIDKKNDIFLYLTKESLYLSIFTGGDLVYSKCLDDGLSKLHDTFLRSTGEKIKYNDFISNLTKLGLEEKNYTENKTKFYMDFKNLFSLIVQRMQNISQYASRMFMIEDFSRIYIGSENGLVPGLPKFMEQSLGIETQDYLFYADFLPEKSGYIDQREILLLANLQSNLKQKGKKEEYLDLSINERPDSFFKRNSGKFLSVLVGIFLAFSCVPGYYYCHKFYNSMIINKKLSELKLNQEKYEKFKVEEERLKKEASDLSESFQKVSDKRKQNIDLLRSLDSKKVNKVRIVFFS